jgi:hypothetical protein
MKTSNTDSTSYEIIDPIERKFFRSSTFSERLEEYFQNVHSLKISIIQNNFSNNGSQCYKIQINETSKKEQLVDIMNKIFEKMQSKTFTDDNGLYISTIDQLLFSYGFLVFQLKHGFDIHHPK